MTDKDKRIAELEAELAEAIAVNAVNVKISLKHQAKNIKLRELCREMRNMLHQALSGGFCRGINELLAKADAILGELNE